MSLSYTNRIQAVNGIVMKKVGEHYNWSEDETKLHIIMKGKGYDYVEKDGMTIFFIGSKYPTEREIKETSIPFEVFSKKHGVKYSSKYIPGVGYTFFIDRFGTRQ